MQTGSYTHYMDPPIKEYRHGDGDGRRSGSSSPHSGSNPFAVPTIQFSYSDSESDSDEHQPLHRSRHLSRNPLLQPPSRQPPRQGTSKQHKDTFVRKKPRHSSDAEPLLQLDTSNWSSTFSAPFSPTIPVPRDIISRHNGDGSLAPSKSILERLGRAKSTNTRPESVEDDQMLPSPSSLGSQEVTFLSGDDEEDVNIENELSDCLDLALGSDNQTHEGVWMPSQKSTLRQRRRKPPLAPSPLQSTSAVNLTANESVGASSSVIGTDLEALSSSYEVIPMDNMSGSHDDAESSLHVPAKAIGNAFKQFSNKVNAGEDDAADDEAEEADNEDDHNENDLHHDYENGGHLQNLTGHSDPSGSLSATASNSSYGHDEAPSSIIDILNPFNDQYGQQSFVSSTKEDEEPETPALRSPPLYGRSLQFFLYNSPIRKRCYELATGSRLNQSITTLLIAETVLLTYQEWTVDRQYMINKRYMWVDWILFIFYIVYTAEMVIKIISYGFHDDSQMFKALRIEREKGLIRRYYEKLTTKFKRMRRRQSTDEANPFLDEGTETHNPVPKQTEAHRNTAVLMAPRAYLRADWNKIDFISIVSFWISFALSMSEVDIKYRCTVFRSLMCLKILRLFNITHGTRMCLKGIRAAGAQCKEVTLFLVCFWILFAVIGVQSFKTSLRRHCVWENPSNPAETYLQKLQFCGSYLDPTTKHAMPWLEADGSSSSQIKGFRCPIYSKCILSENPYGNTVSFDNIFHSLELVFVIMSANTFTDIMYYTMDSETIAASMFFIFSIFFLTVWLLNLVIAVIINSYRVHLEVMENRSQGKGSKFEIKLKMWHIRYADFVSHSKNITKLFNFSSVFVVIIMVSFIFECTKTSDDAMIAFNKYYRAQFVTTMILAGEILIRFLCFVPGGHCRVFFYSIANWIDLILAVITSVIIAPPIYKRLGALYGWLSVFQIARFYRVVISFGFLKEAWQSVFTRIKPFLHLCLFFVLSIYLIGIIMARMFENVISPEKFLVSNQLIMLNLPNVMLSLYTITSTENWTEILYYAQQSAANGFTRFFCSVCLISWFIFSNTVLLNIFIAIITENIGLPESEKKRQQIEQFYRKLKKATLHKETALFDSFRRRINNSQGAEATRTVLIEKMKMLMENYSSEQEPVHKEPSLVYLFGAWISDLFRFIPLYSRVMRALGRVYGRFVLLLKRWVARIKEKRNNAGVGTVDRSLALFPGNNSFRISCQKLVAPGRGVRTVGVQPIPFLRDTFSVIMFIASIAVIVVACYTTPLYKRRMGFYSNEWNWTLYLDLFFSILFTVEFIIKVVADGFAFGPCAYLGSSWNVIDFVVLISFWFAVFAVLFNEYTVLTIVGAIRALRGFRLLTITKGSREAFQFAVISGARRIFTAAIIALSLLIPFALWGLNLFRGKLGSCSDGDSSRAECALEFANEVFKWDVLSPNAFTYPYLEFNTFRHALFTMFQIISLEGWVDLLLNLMNITGFETSPNTFASPGNAIFIVLFNFFSIVLILNVFVSLIINNYSMQTGVAYLSEQQLAWYEVKKILGQVKPSKRIDSSHMSPFRKRLYDAFVSKNRHISRYVKGLLFIHLGGLLSEAYPMSTAGNDVRYAIFMISTSGLLIYNFLSLYAYGPKLFFSNKWNAFRLFVSSGAFVMTFVLFFIPKTTVYNNFDKLFLVAVILFIIPKVDTLNQLLRFASASLPSLFAIIYTWFVLFIVFAMALNQIFGLTRTGPNTTGNLNARTVPRALIMLFRCSFGEGWNYIMYDFAVIAPSCYGGHIYNTDCGEEGLAFVLFIVWNILSMYIFMNIMISVVINNFSYVYHGSGPHAAITREELRKFKRAWNKYDVYGSGYIRPDQFQSFLSSLDGVLSYHVYQKPYRVPEIAPQWITQNSANPYDLRLDFGRLNKVFAHIDFEKSAGRRDRYNYLVVETQLKAVQTEQGPMLKFTDVISEVGYYSRFEDSTCLTLEDFIKRTILMKRINRILRNMSIHAAVELAVTRLRFKSRTLMSSQQYNTAGFDPWTASDFGVSDDEDPFRDT
ncbi:hypothetical protein FOA43_001073 [Brettanomyces nanus]|uniref:Calcium-channel protein CCH1 n=1 Tax=Eeniella nana TaxID=13502 RepID=A0A875S1P0_EENNA|nr:uncharacterized protein FOA43_001073 [Brettanomyces nanus]QPG73759.1 hypothetical protein FOA43_001073 [Brettanomyces nanus]